MKYLKKLYYQNISPNFFKPSNKQTKYKIFKNIKKEIKPKDVIIVTAYDKNYAKIGNISKKSIKKYCNKFNFRNKIFTIPKNFERHPAWYKIKIIDNLLKNKKNKIIFWIDSDAIFSRYVDFRNFLDDYHDFYLVSHPVKAKINSKYKNTQLAISRINTGVMVFKNTKFSYKLIQEVWDNKKFINSGWWDNSAFLDVLGFKGEIKNNLNLHKGNLKYLKKTKLIPLEWNSVPSSSNLEFSLETHEPIILHGAGLNHNHKREIILRYILTKDKIKL